MRIPQIAIAVILFGFPLTRTYRPPGPQAAQSENNASSEAQMKLGEAADAKKDYAAAMVAYRQAINIDPQNVDAHKLFIMASVNQADVAIRKLFDDPDYAKFERGELHGAAKKAFEAKDKKAGATAKAGDNALVATYDDWIATHPKMAAFYWAKGYAFTMVERPSGEEELFQKAISLDPKFAPAYNSMADVEFEKGDYAKQSDYLKQVMDIDPSNSQAAFDYARSLQFTNPAQFRQLAEQYAKRFPRDSRCTYMLYELENSEPSSADRMSVLEGMRYSYVDKPVSTEGMDEPDTFTNLLESSMADLFNLYAQNDPKEALGLAQEMEKQKWADSSWKDAVAYQQNLITALNSIATAKYSDASSLLQHQFAGDIVKYYIDHSPVTLAIAEAQAGAGNTQQAFDTLAAAWIKKPTAELKTGLLKYGAKLGKTPAQVDDSLWQKWTDNAKEMKPFELKKVGSSTKIKLSDFRGKVTLVSFWFPLCGPCREEMPYLDEAAKKYQSQGFSILAINGVPEQNHFAPGVLKNYDITGLQVPSSKWADRYDHVHAFPTNYLLDAQGRIMAHPDVRNLAALKAFELQIDTLLAHTESTQMAAHKSGPTS